MRTESNVLADVRTDLALEDLKAKEDGRHAKNDIQRPVQIRLQVQGDIETGVLRSAWTRLSDKLTLAGRAARSNGNGSAPNGRERMAAWQEYDLRGLSAHETSTWIASFLETDALQGISSMRCSRLYLTDSHSELLWSIHPAVREGIDLAAAIKDFTEFCGAPVQISEMPVAPADDTAPEHRNIARAMPPLVATGTSASEEATQQELIAIWEQVLNTKAIKPTDDFFELGGHSLLAARLMARIEDALGIELPLASLLEAPTVQQQTELVRNYRGNGKAQVRERKAVQATRQLPFFFLGGDPTFRPLSQSLGELRGFHSLGLRMSELSRLEEPKSLERIAEQFVKAIREREPKGPYMLGGWCAHGLLALETARQLQQQGQEVAQVVMLETANPVRMKQYSGWKRTIARAQLKLHLLKFEYAYVQQLNSTQTRNYIAGRTSQKLARIKQSLLRVLKAGKFYPELADPVSGNPLDILYAASAKYQPKPYDGRVALIRSTQRTFGFGHVLDLGWTELLGDDFEIRETPGNHYTIYMFPNVDTLARKINICLKNAEEQLARRP